MAALTLLIIVALFATIAFFVSRRLSPIPYFPSNKNDIKNIVEALQLANNQIVYDLGAGDGIVIFSTATEALHKKLNTRFVAVEINPILIAVMWFRRLLHSNRKNIRIVRADIFMIRYTQYRIPNTKTVFFTYISPWYLEKVFANCKRQITHFKFVSYYYSVPKLKSSRTIKGVHNTHIYNV